MNTTDYIRNCIEVFEKEEAINKLNDLVLKTEKAATDKQKAYSKKTIEKQEAVLKYCKESLQLLYSAVEKESEKDLIVAQIVQIKKALQQ
jgi:hypothetical protein